MSKETDQQSADAKLLATGSVFGSDTSPLDKMSRYGQGGKQRGGKLLWISHHGASNALPNQDCRVYLPVQGLGYHT